MGTNDASPMRILALEFSSDRRSVAVSNDGAVAEAHTLKGGRTTPALGLIRQALEAAHLEMEQIQWIAVGLGPGSYTGIRAAIATAQGWNLARQTRLLGISSVHAMVHEAMTRGMTGIIHPVLSAQRGEFHLGHWQIGHGTCREISPLRIVSAQEVEALRLRNAVLVGPDEANPVVQIHPMAKCLAAMASKRLDESAPTEEPLVPIYLRETMFVKAVSTCPPGINP